MKEIRKRKTEINSYDLIIIILFHLDNLNFFLEQFRFDLLERLCQRLLWERDELYG